MRAVADQRPPLAVCARELSFGHGQDPGGGVGQNTLVEDHMAGGQGRRQVDPAEKLAVGDRGMDAAAGKGDRP